MVKSLNSLEYLFTLDSVYGKAKEKYSVYFTFKRGNLNFRKQSKKIKECSKKNSKTKKANK